MKILSVSAAVREDRRRFFARARGQDDSHATGSHGRNGGEILSAGLFFRDG